MEKINLREKLTLFDDYWNPRIIAELNNQQVKLAKIKGEFVWHKHDVEDELFMVIDGEITIEFRDRIVHLKKGECIVVPKGVEHRPVAKQAASILLFEPSSTHNTGNTESNLSRKTLENI